MNFFVCFLISLLCCVVVNGHRLSKVDGINYRLPNNTRPESYDITLVTNIHKHEFSFAGTVIINLRVLEPSSTITLHARQLFIKSIKLKSIDDIYAELYPFTYDEKTEFLTIPVKSELQKDQTYILTIKYAGELETDKHGFYRSSYNNLEGQTKWLATTQFEPSDARHGFPCYDEPQFKAKFTIHIDHDESYHAISNMKERRNRAVNGRVITDFDQTPKVSTYLIAFIISDFEYNEFIAKNSVTHRVFTTKQNINQTSYAVTEGVRMLKAIENYVKVQFPLSKLDQAAIPDFRVEAMENFGLCTYEEKYILFDPSIHSYSRKLGIAFTIAHEFSHQWFGDLVSPKWWTYLWLNEGFATLFETIVLDLVHPQWNTPYLFILSKLQPVLRFDAQPESRPMTFYVENQDDIGSLFSNNPITYDKSASVIRMFMYALGEETFKKGLTYYLTNNSYSIADDDTLFKSLESAAKEDKTLHDNLNVRDLFGSWSNQKGYPLLKVNRNYKDGSVAVYQEKYDVALKRNVIDPATWWVPINFASANCPIFNETTPFGWIAEGQREIVLEPNRTEIKWNNSDWLIFNRQQTGFYRVLYDEENYNLINKELNDGDFNKIHPINRAQILDDLHAFVKSGHISPNVLWKTLAYLKKENSLIPWETARNIINDLNQSLQASRKLQNFRTFVAHSVESYYKKWSLDVFVGEEMFDALSQNTAINLACEFGVAQCLQKTYARFQEMINSSKITTNIRDLVIANGIRSATDYEIAQLWLIFLKSSNNDERTEILSSIGNIPKYSTVQYYLYKSIEDSKGEYISKSERLLLIQSIINNSQKGVSLGIQFLSSQLEKVNSKVGSLQTILSSIAERILSKEIQIQFYQLLDLAKYKTIISDIDIDLLKNTVDVQLNGRNNIIKSFGDNFIDE